jgi:hypothetical protein
VHTADTFSLSQPEDLGKFRPRSIARGLRHGYETSDCELPYRMMLEFATTRSPGAAG